MNRFGTQLRALREQRDVSVAALARALGVNSANLSRVELGARGPLRDAMIRAAAAYLRADATALLEAARVDRVERLALAKRKSAVARTQYLARVRAEALARVKATTQDRAMIPNT